MGSCHQDGTHHLVIVQMRSGEEQVDEQVDWLSSWSSCSWLVCIYCVWAALRTCLFFFLLLHACTVVLFTGRPNCHTVFSRVVVPPTLSYLTSTITRLIPLYQCMRQLFSVCMCVCVDVASSHICMQLLYGNGCINQSCVLFTLA